MLNGDSACDVCSSFTFPHKWLFSLGCKSCLVSIINLCNKLEDGLLLRNMFIVGLDSWISWNPVLWVKYSESTSVSCCLSGLTEHSEGYDSAKFHFGLSDSVVTTLLPWFVSFEYLQCCAVTWDEPRSLSEDFSLFSIEWITELLLDTCLSSVIWIWRHKRSVKPLLLNVVSLISF